MMRPNLLAITDRIGAKAENGSQVLAGALLDRLRSWYDVHVMTYEGGGGDFELPADVGTGSEYLLPELPRLSLVYNFGATSFSCRATRVVAQGRPSVPLANHYQINLGSYAIHQHLTTPEAQSLEQEQALVASLAVRNLFPSHSELALAADWLHEGLADSYVLPNAFVASDETAAPVPHDGFTFLAAGRYSDPVKGADMLYRAFSQLAGRESSPCLEIVSDSDRFLGILRGLGPHRWHRHPWMSRADLHARMRAADVVVVPSRYEPFGLVALEALALGTPVVAMRVGGLQEVVHHGVTGFLSPAHEGSRGLCAAMEQAVSCEPEALDIMGKRAAETVGIDYSLDRVARLLHSHLDNALVQHAWRIERALGPEGGTCM